MISVGFSASSTAPFSLKRRCSPSFRPILTRYNQLKKLQQQRRRRNGKCRAELATDAPVAMAISACILNSLIFPSPPSQEDVEAESLIDSADARFAVMGIISFIPYFNWMSWVFAWLDTGKRRYAVYAIVYLAPYLRSNLSISPEESWLPIASILLCIFHIQLEASIKSGDFQGFQLLNQGVRKKESDLPPAHQHHTSEIHDWAGPDKPQKDGEILSEDEEANGGSK